MELPQSYKSNFFHFFQISFLWIALIINPLSAQTDILDSLTTELEQTNDAPLQANLLKALYIATYKSKNYPQTREYARRSIQINQKIGKQQAELAAWKILVRSYYYQLERDSALLYLDDFLSLATNLEIDKDLSWANNFYGLIYRNKGEYQLAIDYFEKSLAIRTKLEDKKGIASCYNNLGLVNNNLGNYEKALENYQKSLALKKELNDERGVANLHLNIGGVYNEIGDYPKEYSSYLEVLSYYEKTKDNWGLGSVYNNLGNNLKDQGNFMEALSYYEKSLNLGKAIDDKEMTAMTLANIGNLYGHFDDPDKNKDYLLQALVLEKAIGNQAGIARNYVNLGMTATKLGNDSEALAYLQKSLEIYKRQNTPTKIANVNIEIGQLLLKTGDYRGALKALKAGLAVAKEKGNWVIQEAAYEGLANTYQKLNNFPKAYENYQLYTAAKDTLLNTEKTKQLAQMAAQYEFEKSQTTLQKLRAESVEEKLVLSEKLRNRNMLVGLALAIMALLIGLYAFYRYRQRKQEVIHEQKRVAELMRIDQLKDQFLANTSHELRTPLNGIIGIATSLEDGIAGDLPPKATENLKLITASGRRLSNLVNDILDFSKLKNADLELDLKSVNLHAATNVIFAMTRPLVGNKSIELQNKLPTNIPLISGDEDRIQQILYNLIGNAIKFTESGLIIVYGNNDESFYHLSVADTGIGIPKEELQNIFKSFVQVDGSSTRTASGTGLGLTITKQLVDLHGGKISVDSTVNQGTTFTVCFPLSQATAIPQKNTNQITPIIAKRAESPIKTILNTEKKVAPTIKNNAAINILIVDDEPINRQVLENHLHLEGYNVTQAVDGKAALHLIQEKQQKFDLIILDIMMPRLSGYEVCQQLRQQYSSVELPILMLTAKNRTDDLVEGFEMGANDFLTKPFSKDELISRIKTHLNLGQLNKASNKFVPHEFLHAIGRDSISELKLGDNVQRNVTVMFADIRDYTPLSEQMTPEENFRFVNAFLGRLAPYIRQNKGFINQFLGDGFMAIFTSTENFALKAAIEVQHKLLEYNEERANQNRQPVRLGIGLHTGPLVMGVIGDEERMDPATISDTVNTASRMEGLTKYYGVNIIVSDVFVKKLEDQSELHFRYLGKVKVKGKHQATGIYECFEGDTPEMQSHKLMTMDGFEKGIEAFQAGDFDTASIYFLDVLKDNKEDKAALHFFKKCTDLAKQGLKGEWTGVDIL